MLFFASIDVAEGDKVALENMSAMVPLLPFSSVNRERAVSICFSGRLSLPVTSHLLASASLAPPAPKRKRCGQRNPAVLLRRTWPSIRLLARNDADPTRSIPNRAKLVARAGGEVGVGGLRGFQG